jgi:hypothetical protein
MSALDRHHADQSLSPPESVRRLAIRTHAQFFTHGPITIKLLAMTTLETSSLAQFKFPRTGKRGVPQQFPRNLYDMLEAESKLIEADATHPKIISWSETGKAFKIYDVTEFSVSVLPRYFRTKKFSSFQRNLNLVRFDLSKELHGLPMLRSDPLRSIDGEPMLTHLCFYLSVWLYEGPKRSRPGHVRTSFVCQGRSTVPSSTAKTRRGAQTTFITSSSCITQYFLWKLLCRL